MKTKTHKTTAPKTVTHARSRRVPWPLFTEDQIREACNAPLRETYSGRNRAGYENAAECRASWGWS